MLSQEDIIKIAILEVISILRVGAKGMRKHSHEGAEAILGSANAIAENIDKITKNVVERLS